MSAVQVKNNRNAENGNGVYHSINVNVPDHWKVIRLEEVLDDIIGGGTPSKANPEYWIGSIPWLTVKDMRTRRPEDAIDHISKDAVRDSATNIIPADTVIIATRIGLGKVVRVPYEAAINQDLKALVAKPELEKGYLEYWILSIANYLESIGSGTTVKGIRLEQLRSLPFPLAPLNEQRRIVSEIEKQFSRLDEAVANLKRVKANLKRYKAAVLKAAVEGKLTEDWRKHHPNVEPASKLLERILAERRAKWNGRGKYKEPAQFLEEDCPDLPANWGWASLDSIANVIDPNPSHRMPKYADNGVPFISSENFIGSEGIDFTIGKAVPEKILKEQAERYVIREGDFILTRIGTIGKTRFLPLPQTYCLSHALVIIQGLTSDIDRRYLRYVVASDATIQQAKLGVQSVGVPDLGMAKIRAFRIPLTCEAEQKEIVTEVERRLSVIDELEATVQANLTRADRLRQAILQRAFSGGLI